MISRPKGVKMGTGRALVLAQTLLLLPASAFASLLTLSKCHLITLATSLLPALVVSYGPQLAGPLPATFTFSNRSHPQLKNITCVERSSTRGRGPG